MSSNAGEARHVCLSSQDGVSQESKPTERERGDVVYLTKWTTQKEVERDERMWC